MLEEQALQGFLQRYQLPADFASHAKRWFMPLADQLRMHQQEAKRTLVIGINGSQGSGKSTLASLLTLLFNEQYGLRAIDLSIDDFYLTRDERLALAEDIHPLLATRGVPGTHDVGLLRSILQALSGYWGEIAIPRFDKSQDNRQPSTDWARAQSPLDIVILEGWCLGVRAQDKQELTNPANILERDEDRDGRWRHYVNTQLDRHYHDLYEMIDVWVMLQAPSFDSVYRWRLEQEQKLAEASRTTGNHVMTPEQIARFIQHYQRLTEHALSTLPQEVNYLFKLDEQRQIHEAMQPQPVSLL